MRLVLVFMLILVAAASSSCASARPQANLDTSIRAEPPAPDTSADGNLSAAFDRSNATAGASSGPPTREERLATPKPQKSRLQELQSSLALARNHCVAKRHEACLVELAKLSSSIEALTPADQQSLWELTFRAKVARNDREGAGIAARNWLLSCGPERVDACRRRAVVSLQLVSKDRDSQAKLKGIREADDCVIRAEASALHAKNLPVCLDAAAKVYKHHGDRLMSARIALLKGSRAAADAKRAGSSLPQLELAARYCTEPRCRTIRRRAFQQEFRIQMANNDLNGGARTAMREVALAAESAPEPEQPYARTAVLDKLCQDIDARDGPGSCRKLERQTVGRYFFRDYSRERVRGEGLSRDSVKEVNAHFQVLLDDCLAQEARRLQPPAFETYTVHWIVTNQGRVEQVTLDQKAYDVGPLGECLKGQFAVWRYPRYQGEFQHVEQSFSIRAADRAVRL